VPSKKLQSPTFCGGFSACSIFSLDGKKLNTNALHLETRMKILKDIFKMIFLNNSITI
jgi:hypothetical protein